MCVCEGATGIHAHTLYVQQTKNGTTTYNRVSSEQDALFDVCLIKLLGLKMAESVSSMPKRWRRELSERPRSTVRDVPYRWKQQQHQQQYIGENQETQNIKKPYQKEHSF
jgi:hypothetical protein